MAVSHHTRKGKPRRHTNGTFGAHVNGKRIDTKLEYIYGLNNIKGEKDGQKLKWELVT